MRKLTLILLVLVFGVQFGSAVEIWSSYVKTNRYDFTVQDDEIAKTPVWRERDEHPPLSARKALRLARARLAELISDSKAWPLDKLSLTERSHGHWVYLAVFEFPHIPSPSGPSIKMTIPVLMSGVAVKPKVSPWPR